MTDLIKLASAIFRKVAVDLAPRKSFYAIDGKGYGSAEIVELADRLAALPGMVVVFEVCHENGSVGLFATRELAEKVVSSASAAIGLFIRSREVIAAAQGEG